MVSAETGQGLPALIEKLTHEAAGRLGSGWPDQVVLTQERHRAAIAQGHDALARFVHAGAAASGSGASGSGAGIELQAEELRLAADALGRVVGKVGVEDVLGEIFGRFCIGK